MDAVSTLRFYATESLASNARDGPFLTAGYWQYRSLWVRDICFAAEDLVRLGYKSQVQFVVKLYLEHLDVDGRGPKGFDSESFEWRQVKSILRRAFCLCRTRDPLDQLALQPFYKDSASGREAFDTNALIIIAAHACNMELSERQLMVMLRYYARTMDGDGLLRQHAYSDWQDSRQRSGATFLSHLLVWRALTLSAHVAAVFGDVLKFEARIHEAFFDSTSRLYKTRANQPSLGLDGNVLALRWRFRAARKPIFYIALSAHPLWLRSAVTWPPEDNPQIVFWLRLIGLSDYHGSVRWSWILGAQAQLAREHGTRKEYMALVTQLAAVCAAEGHVPEIFHPGKGPLRAWKSWFYRSDGPFTWGAAFCAAAVLDTHVPG